MAIGTGLTYAKKGWVTVDEVKAADFIRIHTPADALFLGQGSIKFAVRYYGKRAFVHPPETIFLSGEPSELKTYLVKQKTPYQEASAVVLNRRTQLAAKLAKISQLLKGDLANSELEAFIAELNSFSQQKNSYLFDTTYLQGEEIIADQPIFLIYNENKFSSLYGSRAWWRKSNFYGANLERLNTNYPIVYAQDGIKIWQAR